MTKTTFTKMFAVAALAVLLTPIAASAHGLGLGFNGFFGRGGKEDTRTHDHKAKGEHDVNKNASTSASAITKGAARVQTAADLLASMSGTLSTKIAGADISAQAKADANANLSDYNSNVASAKSKASAAATAAAQVGSSTSSTTSASILTEARADLSAAWDFLKSAKQELRNILNSLWG